MIDAPYGKYTWSERLTSANRALKKQEATTNEGPVDPKVGKALPGMLNLRFARSEDGLEPIQQPACSEEYSQEAFYGVTVFTCYAIAYILTDGLA